MARTNPQTVDFKSARELPRDRRGLIVGTHIMREYRLVPLYVYRISITSSVSGSASPLFHIDLAMEGGSFMPLHRQLSFPSLSDCLGARRSVRPSHFSSERSHQGGKHSRL